MNDLIEKVKQGLRCCKNSYPKDCKHCPYEKDCTHHETCDILIRNALSVIESLQSDVKILTENNIGIDEQRGEIAVRLEALRLENERLKAKPPKSAWIHRADIDYKDKNGVVHFHGMCENCGFIHDFLDEHTGQYKFCPECGSKNEQWKDGDGE